MPIMNALEAELLETRMLMKWKTAIKTVTSSMAMSNKFYVESNAPQLPIHWRIKGPVYQMVLNKKSFFNIKII